MEAKSTLWVVDRQALQELLQQETDRILTAIGKNTQPQSDVWIRSVDVPTYLGVCKRTWQEYRDLGLIPFCQIGRIIWVKRSDLDAFIESYSVGKSSK